MRRTVNTLAASALAIGALVLAGCSGGTTDSGADSGAETDDQASDVSGDLTVYAAASLQGAFDQLGDSFMEAHPNTNLTFSFDGSSVLATQILSGAPVDVFASADEPNMAKITDEGLTLGEPDAFATSELVIAVQPGNPFGIESLADLAAPGPDGDDPVVVVCAAEVPCGNASRQLLDRDGVEVTPASEEQNVTAVLTKVREGEADAGLVYRSDVLSTGGEVEGIDIAAAEEAAGAYMIAAIDGTASPEAAEAWIAYLNSDEAQELLGELGFGPARD